MYEGGGTRVDEGFTRMVRRRYDGGRYEPKPSYSVTTSAISHRMTMAVCCTRLSVAADIAAEAADTEEEVICAAMLLPRRCSGKQNTA